MWMITIHRFRCPNCGFHYREEVWVRSIRLGPPLHVCAKCKKVFRDADGEWPTLARNQKRRYLTEGLFVWPILWMAFLLFAFWDWRSGKVREFAWWTLSFCGVLCSLALVGDILIRLIGIGRSIKRFNQPADSIHLRCVFCGFNNLKDGTYCISCGQKLPVAVV